MPDRSGEPRVNRGEPLVDEDVVPSDAYLSHGRTRIARARLDRDLSQQELAERARLSPRTIERLDRGELDNPGIRHIIRLASVLEVPVEALVEDDWRDPLWRPN